MVTQQWYCQHCKEEETTSAAVSMIYHRHNGVLTILTPTSSTHTTVMTVQSPEGEQTKVVKKTLRRRK